MTDFFRSWILALSGVIVFGSMCEMILPSGAYKKYIHLVIGIMLVLTVLNPVIKGEIDIEIDIPDSASENMKKISAEQRQNEDIIIIYKKKLSESIKEKTGNSEIDVECEICKNEDKFGEIERIIIKSDSSIEKELKYNIAKEYGLSPDKVIIEEDTYGN